MILLTLYLNMASNFDKIKHIHFIGIGGIGVSAIARMFILEKKIVSGSDASQSKTTEELEKLGATIFYTQVPENIPADTELVVYTIAIPVHNPEFVEAKKLGIPMLSYPELLGVVSKDKYTIAISGTHGKTTTTAMIAQVLIDAKLDPTVIVGSFLKGLDPSTGSGQESNFIAGEGNYFIVEACEYRRSFLNIHPKIIVITNIDNDHLDYYKDIQDIQNAFIEFVSLLPQDGYLICNTNDPLLFPVLEKVKGKVINYMDFPDVTIGVPGEHNRLNGRAAQAVSKILNIDSGATLQSLKDFGGTWRRFEYKGKMKNGALVYDDYGHHPTEIAATIAATREKFPDKKITIIFQPHLYSRTKLLLNDFAKVLSIADYIIVTDIYAAREPNSHSISAEDLVEKISNPNKNVFYMPVFEDIVLKLSQSKGEKDVIMTLGAGDIYKVSEALTLS